jgi:uncharacterized protein YegL
MSQRRLPVYLLVDCSESMAGPAIESVSKGVGALVDQLRANPLALETAYLSVITFSRYARQDVPLTEVMSFQPPKLSVRPGTALGAALDLLVKCIGREVVKTTATTKGDYRPLVFLMTDGQPTDAWEAAADRIKAARNPSLANIYAIGCGPDVDAAVLKRLTDIVLLMPEVTPEKFKKFFVWLSASVQAASQRVESGGDAKGGGGPDMLGLASLPDGVLEEAGASGGGYPSGASSDYPSGQKYDSPRQVFLHARCSRTKKPYLMRYARRPYDIAYEPIAAHPLEDFGEDDGQAMPPINSSMLDGAPPCPYCGNVGGGMCDCGALFCLAPGNRDPVTCPKCSSSLKLGHSGDFDIRRAEG